MAYVWLAPAATSDLQKVLDKVALYSVLTWTAAQFTSHLFVKCVYDRREDSDWLGAATRCFDDGERVRNGLPSLAESDWDRWEN